MPYAVELALDSAAADAVRLVWRELADAGIGYVAGSGARPHVTFGIWDSLDFNSADAELARFAAETDPVGLTLASVGLFPGTAVFLAPTVTTDLLGLHASLHRRFARFGTGAWNHYREDTWVPHCTLALDMEPDQFGTALAIAGRLPLPVQCRLVEAGIVEFRPVKQLASRTLGRR
jgi:2'-5' RNA ligase